MIASGIDSPSHFELYRSRFSVLSEETISASGMIYAAYHLLYILGQFEALFQPICLLKYRLSYMSCWLLEAAVCLDEHASAEDNFTWSTACSHLQNQQIIIRNPLELQQFFVFCLTGIITFVFINLSPESQIYNYSPTRL